jgi:hypothetical protein
LILHGYRNCTCCLIYCRLILVGCRHSITAITGSSCADRTCFVAQSTPLEAYSGIPSAVGYTPPSENKYLLFDELEEHSTVVASSSSGSNLVTPLLTVTAKIQCIQITQEIQDENCNKQITFLQLTMNDYKNPFWRRKHMNHKG